MPMRINWPSVSEALGQVFGIKGRVDVALDEALIPVAQVADLSGAPYNRTIIPGGQQVTAGAGGAGRESGVMAQPGANVILVVRGVYILNQSGGRQDYIYGWMNAAHVAAVANPVVSNVISFNSKTRGVGYHLASTLTAFDVAAPAMFPIGRVSLADDAAHYRVIPGGFALYGSDAGAGAFGIECTGANVGMITGWFVEEYKLPG